MTLTRFEVGKEFPGAVPRIEGAVMELWGDGLVVLIQMPECSHDERRAFKAGFKRYSYLEASGPVPVAVWIFDFQKPHGPIDCNFNSRIVKPELIASYLGTSSGIKNSVTFYLLDGRIIRAIKLVGLDRQAVELFHATIRKQLAMDYSDSEYGRYLASLMHYSTEELFEMGRRFRHGR